MEKDLIKHKRTHLDKPKENFDCEECHLTFKNKVIYYGVLTTVLVQLDLMSKGLRIPWPTSDSLIHMEFCARGHTLIMLAHFCLFLTN